MVGAARAQHVQRPGTLPGLLRSAGTHGTRPAGLAIGRAGLGKRLVGLAEIDDRHALAVIEDERLAAENLFGTIWDFSNGPPQGEDRDKALALLKRHFFRYERYQAVRSKEMMEARVDAVFASLIKDPDFIALTEGADGRLPAARPKMMSPAEGSLR